MRDDGYKPTGSSACAGARDPHARQGEEPQRVMGIPTDWFGPVNPRITSSLTHPIRAYRRWKLRGTWVPSRQMKTRLDEPLGRHEHNGTGRRRSVSFEELPEPGEVGRHGTGVGPELLVAHAWGPAQREHRLTPLLVRDHPHRVVDDITGGRRDVVIEDTVFIARNEGEANAPFRRFHEPPIACPLDETSSPRAHCGRLQAPRRLVYTSSAGRSIHSLICLDSRVIAPPSQMAAALLLYKTDTGRTGSGDMMGHDE